MLENVHKRHEYQLTFKGPTITPPDSFEIPFFDVGGHVIAGKDRVRLTASLPDQQGWIWSKTASSFDGFQIELEFKITGNSRIGADGLALWVTQARSYSGPALGASAIFHGLGILFDTFDPTGHRRNPVVLGLVNDGTKAYHPDNDGKDVRVGQCYRDLRNLPFPVQCRVTYFNGHLTVAMTTGLVHQSANDTAEECFQAPVILPKADYYFGVTSATGGNLADDHDVERMEVWSLVEMKAEDERRKAEEEKKQYEEDYQQKLDGIAKTESEQEKHKKDGEHDLGDKGISQNLMAIWHELAAQHNSLKNLIKAVESVQGGMSVEVKTSLETQLDGMRKEILGSKNSVETLSRKMENTDHSYQNQQAFSAIHNSVDGLKSEIMKIFEKVTLLHQGLTHIRDKEAAGKSAADNCGTCVSLPLMVILGSLQSALVIGFLIYQKSRDNAAKKFY